MMLHSVLSHVCLMLQAPLYTENMYCIYYRQKFEPFFLYLTCLLFVSHLDMLELNVTLLL